MRHLPRTTRQSGLLRHVVGFTLMEVMIALGIFAIGMIAVASLFPAAALMQRETVDDLLSQQLARNSAALLDARKVKSDELGAVSLDDTDVLPLLRTIPNNKWSLNDRSYTSMRVHEETRKFYWTPLIRRTEPHMNKWNVFVFIMRRGESTYDLAGAGTAANPDTDPNTIPHVFSAAISQYNGRQFFFNNDHWGGDGVPDQVRSGDQILDNNGTVYTVVFATADSVTVSGFIFPNPNTPRRIWYGRPANLDKSSPTRRILVLSDVVQP